MALFEGKEQVRTTMHTNYREFIVWQNICSVAGGTAHESFFYQIQFFIFFGWITHRNVDVALFANVIHIGQGDG